jgi:methylated-DNA-[protein]-cysteine S-methyltransferase
VTAVRVFDTPLGRMAVAANGRGVVRVALPGQCKEVAAVAALAASCPPVAAAVRIAGQAEREICEYVAGRRRTFSVPVDLEGLPPFHRTVSEALRRVAYGRTVTYGGLARRVGRPGAARAVGQAMARNPVPLLVPCHRVLAAGGRLGGFGGGPDLKRRLLDLEGAL